MNVKIIIGYFKKCKVTGAEPTVEGLMEYKANFDKIDAVITVAKATKETTKRVIKPVRNRLDIKVFTEYMAFCKAYGIEPKLEGAFLKQAEADVISGRLKRAI